MDMLRQTYQLADIKPDIKNYEFINIPLNNVKEELNNTRLSVRYKYERDDSVDVKLNYPGLLDLTMPMDTLIMNSRPIIKPEIRVVLKKLPKQVSSTTLIYCPTCLLAFTDSDRFNMHLNLNIHNTNECSFCRTNYENGTKLWEHTNSVHIDDISKKAKNNKRIIQNVRKLRIGKEMAELSDEKFTEKQQKKKSDYICHAKKEKKNKQTIENVCRLQSDKEIAGLSNEKVTKKQRGKKSDNVRICPADLIEERRKKYREYARKWRAKLTEEQRNKIRENKRKLASDLTDERRKKIAEYNRNYCANMSEEQRKKRAEHQRKRNANLTEEDRKKKSEWNQKWLANMTEEQRKKRAENDRTRSINMTEEQRKKKSEKSRKWYTNLTDEQRKIKAEQRRIRIAKMKTFDVSPVLLNVILSEGASSPNTL